MSTKNFSKSMSVGSSVKTALVSSFVALGILAPAQSLLAASLEIGLVIDGSGSVSSSDFALQRDAYVNIFNNDFVGNFLTGDVDTVYASFFQFASSTQQEVGWVTIQTNADAQAFASAISSVTQLFGGTNTAGAINTVANSILTNAFDGDSEVIDLSSDGFANDQVAAEAAAANALSDGIVTNTLFVGTDPFGQAALADIAAAGGGTDFVANSFDEYEDALTEKLESEVNGGTIPEPASILGLLTLGGLGLTLKSKKKG
jgi:hypothetical protein